MIGAETDFQGTSITGGNQGNVTLASIPGPLYIGLGHWRTLTPLVTGNGGNLGLSVVRHRARPRRLPRSRRPCCSTAPAASPMGRWTPSSFSNTNTGWTAGGGVEWLFAPHWSAKVEYLYVDLSSSEFGCTYSG